jgi:hypothetical protein
MRKAEGSLLTYVDPIRDNSWDEMLATVDGTTFFHHAAWARVLHLTYGYSPMYFLGGTDMETLVCPLMEVDSRLSGRRGIALPFTDECDILGNPANFRRLFHRLLTLGKERRWKYLELRGAKQLPDDSIASVSFHGHKLALETDPAKIFARFSGAVRTAIRKAEQWRLEVDITQSSEAVRMFYQLLCKTRSRHGMPPQPLRFFENICTEVIQKGLGYTVLARHAGVPVAGAVFFHSSNKAIYKFAASDEQFKHLQANNLVLWKAIEFYAEKGFSSMDFGRTSLSNSGLRRFKLAWNTQERPISYVRFENKTNAFVTTRDQASGSWFTELYKLLPPSLGRFVGAALYKHLA